MKNGTKQLHRTRFLEDLDRMLAVDSRGAIDDMLQVLRERGVIKEAFAEEMMDDRRSSEEGIRNALKRSAANSIGRLLLDDGVLEFSEKPARDRPFTTTLLATASFVVMPDR